jgi:hypothetical protein
MIVLLAIAASRFPGSAGVQRSCPGNRLIVMRRPHRLA